MKPTTLGEGEAPHLKPLRDLRALCGSAFVNFVFCVAGPS